MGRVILVSFRPLRVAAGASLPFRKGIAMTELRERMIQDLKLAGLGEGTQQRYLQAVRQLTAYYMVSPDQLSERQVQDYILYLRDELAIAKGTFEPMFFGLKFFFVNTLGYEWPLFTKKKYASHATSGSPTSGPMTIVGV